MIHSQLITRLWVGQFPVLQRGHVAPEAELLAVQPLQVVLPLRDLALDLRLAPGVGHHRHLQLGHVLQLLILRSEREKDTQYSDY